MERNHPRSEPNVRLYPYSPYGCAGHSPIDVIGGAVQLGLWWLLCVGGVWKVLILCTCDARLLDDKVDHTVLIHVVFKVFVYFYTDTDELFVSCISDLVCMLVECLDNCIPFVDVVGQTDDHHRT